MNDAFTFYSRTIKLQDTIEHNRAQQNIVNQTGPFNMGVLNKYKNFIEREQTQNNDDCMMWFLVCLFCSLLSQFEYLLKLL